MERVLLAPNDPASPTPSSSSPTAREDANLNYALIALCVALFTYSLISGIGLANGTVPAERAYILMMPIPLVLLIWNSYGAARSRPLDAPCALLAGGWAMLLLTLELKHLAVQSALSAGRGVADASDSPLVWLCALLCVGLLGAGAFFGFRRWQAQG